MLANTILFLTLFVFFVTWFSLPAEAVLFPVTGERSLEVGVLGRLCQGAGAVDGVAASVHQLTTLTLFPASTSTFLVAELV